jgi:peroxiredoxin
MKDSIEVVRGMLLRSIHFVSLSALGVACGCAAAQTSNPAQSPRSRSLADVVAPKSAPPVPKTDLANLLDNGESGAGESGDTPAQPMMSAHQRGWLGVALRTTEAGSPGVLVQTVLRGSPAASAGLEVGDVVLGVDGKPVSSPSEMVSLIAQAGAGNRANLMLKRSEQHKILAVPLAQDPGPEGRLRMGFVDSPAPEFADVEVVQGEIKPDLASLKGRVVVLEFWATWCVACRAMLPAMNALHERYESQGATVIGVTMDPAEKAKNAAFELGMRYPVLSDVEGSVAQSYQAYALPTVFVIDRQGVVRDVSVGYDPDHVGRLQRTLDRLVHER